jgi:tRNA modification GTPase
LEQLGADTNRLLATSHYGAMLREGIRTVILGESNAGKSSLLNRLVGRDRALVSAEPGTTRDYLEEIILAGPHALRLVDTAGLNLTPSSLEKRGIDKTLEQAAEADIFLWVLDGTRALPALPEALVARLTSANTIAVFNKADLPQAAPVALPQKFRRVEISALTGQGVEGLRATIAQLADTFQSKVGDELIAINARHAQALALANESLAAARQKLVDHAAGELVASDLRAALAAFGEISGKIDNEQILDRLFATFCIGK